MSRTRRGLISGPGIGENRPPDCISSEEKANTNLEATDRPAWDRQDPVNAGIEKVEPVASAGGVSLRRITHVEPVTGTRYVFPTNEMTLRPGLIIALLYKLRWGVERVFDQLKNKLQEQQAWESRENAKAMQAQVICLLHNLLQLVEKQHRREGIENEAEKARRRKGLVAAQGLAKAAGRTPPRCVVTLQRLSQHSVKLLPWLRSSLADRLLWQAATPRFRFQF